MNDLNHIITIVPRLPPAVDGLGDYGLSLAKQLRQDFGLVTEFLVGDPHWSGESLIEGFVVKSVREQSSAALLEILPKIQDSSTTVFLHYVGYGYAKRGCPVWLVEGLEHWRTAMSNRYLLTMFHELYGFGAIWTTQFWLSSLQKNLAARLVRLSDRCLTSKEGYGEIISQFSQGKHLRVLTLPVFSNIGEPKSVTALSERTRNVVIFGGGGPRSRVYQRSQLALQRICQELEIEEILDIGPKLNFSIPPVNGIPVKCLGVQSPMEISNLLSNSMVGFFNYHRAFLAKSTIFAAYCAHRVLPVGGNYYQNKSVGFPPKSWLHKNSFPQITKDSFIGKCLGVYEEEDVDRLENGKHYLISDNWQQKIDLTVGQTVADNAYAWYQEHQLSVQANIFGSYLQKESE